MIQVLGKVDYHLKSQKEKFEIIELKEVPQRYLQWIPKRILDIFKRTFGNVIVQLRVKVKVLK